MAQLEQGPNEAPAREGTVAKSDAQKDVSGIVQDLAERARMESIGSIDHAVNAKAVALSNDEVKAAIREMLDRDYQLIAIEPVRGFGSSLMSFPLRFLISRWGEQRTYRAG